MVAADPQPAAHTVSAKVVEGPRTCRECRRAFQSPRSGGTGCTATGLSLNICIIQRVLLRKQPSLHVNRLWGIVLACHSVTKQTFVGFLKAQQQPLNQNPACPGDKCSPDITMDVCFYVQCFSWEFSLFRFEVLVGVQLI